MSGEFFREEVQLRRSLKNFSTGSDDNIHSHSQKANRILEETGIAVRAGTLRVRREMKVDRAIK